MQCLPVTVWFIFRCCRILQLQKWDVFAFQFSLRWVKSQVCLITQQLSPNELSTLHFCDSSLTNVKLVVLLSKKTKLAVRDKRRDCEVQRETKKEQKWVMRNRGPKVETDAGLMGSRSKPGKRDREVLSDMPAGPCVPAHRVRWLVTCELDHQLSQQSKETRRWSNPCSHDVKENFIHTWDSLPLKWIMQSG